MSVPDRIQGFVFAIVTDNDDPEATGRIKVCIPGLIEPRSGYWIMPANWPGAGGVGKGSQYPPPDIDAQVVVMFEYGIYQVPESRGVYMTGYYGLNPDGQQAGPTIVSDAATAADAQKRVVLWEGSSLIAYIIEDDNEERLVLQAKATGSKIEINAKDGQGGKSETIYIEGRTGISIYSKGLIDIQGDCGVQINGRTVDDITIRSV